ncbi:MAG: type I-E CRISPR-associated protein Cas7/Cse4/CasC, partial [Chloroflexota bacterium]
VTAIPTGKQNSMAAHNPPSLVLAIVRSSPAQNLANAFANPVAPNREGDLVENSVRKLDEYRGSLAQAYGEEGILGAWVTVVGAHKPIHLGQQLPLQQVIEHAVQTAAQR